MPETILKHTAKTALTLVLFTIAFTTLMSYVYYLTKAPIAASEEAARKALFRQIVPENMYDNAILEDSIKVEPNELLGNKRAKTVYRARINNRPAAVILETIAPDGYSGVIKLLIAIKYDGTISGVRVLAHKETPGLGDYINIAKTEWITLFNDESLKKTSSNYWQVKKDGGKFDYMAGATITPRAVIKAVYKTLQYFKMNKEALFVATPIIEKETQEATQNGPV